MKNTTGACLAAGGREAPEEPGGRLKQCKKGGEHSSPSLRLINFVLHMCKPKSVIRPSKYCMVVKILLFFPIL